MTRALEPIGYERFAYVVLRAEERAWPYLLTNYPDEWVARYVERDYQTIDPIMQALQTCTGPFVWADLPLDDKQKALFAEAESFGIWHGLTVPIHGPRGSLALLSLACARARRDPGPLLRDRLHRIQLLAMMFHDIMTQRFHKIEPPGVSLSRRERECLLWTARGKTAWEIAEILDIREATVVFHLKNAARRLGVHSRFHATVKAIMAGIITP